MYHTAITYPQGNGTKGSLQEYDHERTVDNTAKAAGSVHKRHKNPISSNQITKVQRRIFESFSIPLPK